MDRSTHSPSPRCRRSGGFSGSCPGTTRRRQRFSRRRSSDERGGRGLRPHGSPAPTIRDLEVAPPALVLLLQLPPPDDEIASFHHVAGEPLREPRRVSPNAPRVLVDAHV